MKKKHKWDRETLNELFIRIKDYQGKKAINVSYHEIYEIMAGMIKETPDTLTKLQKQQKLLDLYRKFYEYYNNLMLKEMFDIENKIKELENEQLNL